ncbi:Thioredoxin reductase [Candidatus Hepatincola sp. Av]
MVATIHNLIIIGAGPAGYSAAIYAQRAGLKPILIQGSEPGGQLMQTTDVDNYPGFATILGPTLMMNMHAQVDKLGVEIIADVIESVDFSKKPLQLKGMNSSYSCKSVIIATGSSAKWLKIPSENTFKGFGISACATCDGFFFKNKNVAVIGGGNTAVEEALYLSKIAKKVVLIHRRDELRAEQILQDTLFKTKNIEILWNKVVTEFQGVEGELTELQSLVLEDTLKKTQQTLKVDGAFIAIGHTPNTKFLQGQVDLDPDGYITSYNNSTFVTLKGKPLVGVFAAGDVNDKIYRQAITSAGSGCKAALDAQQYLLKK